MAEQQSSSDFLGSVLRAELASVNAALSPLGVVNDVDGTLRPDQLDRALASEGALAEMTATLSTPGVEDEASTARLIHEATRARRDINIAQASHKKLLLGCYRTLYQRKLKLERDIQEERYV